MTEKTRVEAGGATFHDLIMLRVYLTTQADFAAMNEAYGTFMALHAGAVLPSRTTVFTGLPLPQMLVEIDGLAVI